MNNVLMSTAKKLPFGMLTISLCLIGIFGLTACSKGGDKKATTQVVAKVNNAEISMHQINLLIKTVPNVNAENVSAVRKQILEKLIDQQIIIEKANKESLDRTPDVILAIEAAKKEILANAYLQSMINNSPKINESEIKKYYAEHTGLFAKRRIYTLQDISVDKNTDTLALLNEQVAKQKTMQEIVSSLQAKDIKHSGGAYVRPAEQLPLDLVPKLQDLTEGKTIVLELGDSIHVLHLVKAENAPMDRATATPFIQNYFLNTRGKELIQEKMKQFRKEAKIEYIGDFADNAKKAAPMPADSNVGSKQNDPENKKSSIDAGVAGLK